MTVQTLAGKMILLGVTGSIAAVETVKLVHALRRKGAVVQPVMSAAATGIIHPDALTYASGRDTITRISGHIEHVEYCGDEGIADLFLIAPCTANTIGKIAYGIDDTPVTTCATTAIGSGTPMLVVPAMHQSMYRHPGVLANLATLRSWGITVAEPRIEEGKAKIAANEEIVLLCERLLMGAPLAKKRVLVTSGACREPVDDVRVLTTRASGTMGRELALEAWRLGAEVTIVHRDMLPLVTNIAVETATEMHDAVHRYFRNKPADIYISAAAISDFAPVRSAGKLKSGKALTLELKPLPKLLESVVKKYPKTQVTAFKIGDDTGPAAETMLASGIGSVMANAPVTMGSRDGQYVLMTRAGRKQLSGSKDEIAHGFWKELLSGTTPKKRKKSR